MATPRFRAPDESMSMGRYGAGLCAELAMKKYPAFSQPMRATVRHISSDSPAAVMHT